MGHQMSANLGALSLWGAFLLGLTGGFGHCLVMCGPLVAAASLTDGAACGAGASTRTAARGAGRVPGRLPPGPADARTRFWARCSGCSARRASSRRCPGRSLRRPSAASSSLPQACSLLAMGVLLLVAWIRGRKARLPEPTAAIASLPWFGRTVARLREVGRLVGLPARRADGAAAVRSAAARRAGRTGDRRAAVRRAHHARVRPRHGAGARRLRCGERAARQPGARMARPDGCSDRWCCSALVTVAQGLATAGAL